jgi:acyl carrier protein
MRNGLVGGIGPKKREVLCAAVSEAQTVVVSTIRGILARRSAEPEEISLDARLQDDLTLDSLELAELSVTLEDHFGTDPYSAGILPQTVGDVIRFYQGAA